MLFSCEKSKKPKKSILGLWKKSGRFFHVFGRIFWLRRQISSSNSSKWSEKDSLSNDMSNYVISKKKCVGQSFGTMEISRNRYFDLDIEFFKMFFDESYIHACLFILSKFRGKIMIFTYSPHQFTFATNIYGHPLFIRHNFCIMFS